MIVSARCLAEFVPLALSLSRVFNADSGATKVFLREEFNKPDQRKPFYFEKIDRHNSYAILRTNNESFLKTESEGPVASIAFMND
ncbi:MAG: hypothetical protein GTN74_10180 [Proteobacteria bacterium]|nr:hypothetical protein [Pseudomonadota bacterium]NIS70451.1 hypothetical protein [Pseudomonadota bacterium]